MLSPSGQHFVCTSKYLIEPSKKTPAGIMMNRLDRVEFKFLVDRSLRERLVEEIRRNTTCDAITGTTHYPIISQYYDNEYRDCYWEKQRTQKSRRKLRIRVYGSENGELPPTTFIEVKHKHFGRGAKRRLMLSTEDALDLVEGDGGHLLANLDQQPRSTRMILREIRQLVEDRDFKFLCTMRYDREVYVGREDAPDLRITMDSGIACRFGHLPLKADTRDFEHYLLREDQSILEIKTNSVIPIWLRNLIGDHSLVRQSYSKFCTALETFDPAIRELLLEPDSSPFTAPPPDACIPALLTR